MKPTYQCLLIGWLPDMDVMDDTICYSCLVVTLTAVTLELFLFNVRSFFTSDFTVNFATTAIDGSGRFSRISLQIEIPDPYVVRQTYIIMTYWQESWRHERKKLSQYVNSTEVSFQVRILSLNKKMKILINILYS